MCVISVYIYTLIRKTHLSFDSHLYPGFFFYSKVGSWLFEIFVCFGLQFCRYSISVLCSVSSLAATRSGMTTKASSILNLLEKPLHPIHFQHLWWTPSWKRGHGYITSLWNILAFVENSYMLICVVISGLSLIYWTVLQIMSCSWLFYSLRLSSPWVAYEINKGVRPENERLL